MNTPVGRGTVWLRLTTTNTQTIQGSVATYLRCGGNFHICLVGNFVLFHTVKKFWKSIKIWQSYGPKYLGMSATMEPSCRMNWAPALLAQRWCRLSRSCREVVGVSLGAPSAFFSGENSSSRSTSHTAKSLYKTNRQHICYHYYSLLSVVSDVRVSRPRLSDPRPRPRPRLEGVKTKTKTYLPAAIRQCKTKDIERGKDEKS